VRQGEEAAFTFGFESWRALKALAARDRADVACCKRMHSWERHDAGCRAERCASCGGGTRAEHTQDRRARSDRTATTEQQGGADLISG
jgi:hypothetical protein